MLALIDRQNLPSEKKIPFAVGFLCMLVIDIFLLFISFLHVITTVIHVHVSDFHIFMFSGLWLPLCFQRAPAHD